MVGRMILAADTIQPNMYCYLIYRASQRRSPNQVCLLLKARPCLTQCAPLSKAKNGRAAGPTMFCGLALAPVLRRPL